MSEADYAHMTGRQIRALCRSGEFARPTAGVAIGFVQTNLVILRSELAGDFGAFCRLNPKPCPVLSVLDPGSYEPVDLAAGADLRTDLPGYRVYRHGRCADRPSSITSIWEDGLVAFLIGCSFTFESTLLEAGLPVRHIEEGRNVPMYRTNISCVPAGSFNGPLVVSMRPMDPTQAAQAEQITRAFDSAHGGPVHVGNPLDIGIEDVARPDYGDSVTIHYGEVPVFWACGVTPMEALKNAKPSLAITHDPGRMFVTDVRDSIARHEGGN